MNDFIGNFLLAWVAAAALSSIIGLVTALLFARRGYAPQTGLMLGFAAAALLVTLPLVIVVWVFVLLRRAAEPLTSQIDFRAWGRSLLFLIAGLSIVYLVTFGITYKIFDGNYSDFRHMADYQSVLMVNALIGLSVLLFVVELRWDALRVALTVVVALLFGFVVTALFNLDSADRFETGEFKAKVVSANPSPVNVKYNDSALEGTFDSSTTEADYHFIGKAGDVVSIVAFAGDGSTVDLKVDLLNEAGDVLAESLGATPDQLETFKSNLQSELDGVIENFALPADGFYTIRVAPETPGTNAEGAYGMRLTSEAESLVDIGYGDAKGTEFNNPDAKEPITEMSYRFAGRAGDVVDILAFAARPNTDLDVEVALLGPDGKKLAENQDASAEQMDTFKRDLKTKGDAAISGFTLPDDGVYTVHVQPDPISGGTRFDEMMKETRFAYKAFLLGPLSRLNRWATWWIRDGITLIMLGLSIAIVFRANQFSLGAEGQLYFGALVSGAITLSFGDDVPKTLLVPIALFSAATVGFLWGLLPGALKAYLGANELVSTLMLNTIATRFYEMVLTFQLKPAKAGYIASGWIPKNGLLSPIIDVSGDQITIAIYILVALVVLTWLLIQRTPIGYEIRMIGSNVKFASYGGVNTKRTIMLTMAISGAVAGLAGAHLAMGVHRMLILNISVGLAFEGVVVALLARNNPLVVPFTGLLYQYLRAGARVMESDTDVSFEVVRIIQAVIILLITAEALVTFFRRRRIRRRGTVELDIEEPQHLVTPPHQQTEEGGAHV